MKTKKGKRIEQKLNRVEQTAAKGSHPFFPFSSLSFPRFLQLSLSLSLAMGRKIAQKNMQKSTEEFSRDRSSLEPGGTLDSLRLIHDSMEATEDSMNKEGGRETTKDTDASNAYVNITTRRAIERKHLTRGRTQSVEYLPATKGSMKNKRHRRRGGLPKSVLIVTKQDDLIRYGPFLCTCVRRAPHPFFCIHLSCVHSFGCNESCDDLGRTQSGQKRCIPPIFGPQRMSCPLPFSSVSHSTPTLFTPHANNT